MGEILGTEGSTEEVVKDYWIDGRTKERELIVKLEKTQEKEDEQKGILLEAVKAEQQNKYQEQIQKQIEKQLKHKSSMEILDKRLGIT